MVSSNGRVAENLARAGQWAEQAAQQGAELVLLPELFAIGLEINANAWSFADPQGGPTERWLTETARRHGFYIGGSYLERRGDGWRMAASWQRKSFYATGSFSANNLAR